MTSEAHDVCRMLALVVVMALAAAGCRQTTSPVTTEGPVQVAEPQAPAPTRPPAASPLPSDGVAATTEPITTPTPAPSPIPSPSPAPPPTPTPTPAPDLIEVALALSTLEDVPCPSAAVAAQVSCMLARMPVDIDRPDPAHMIELMVAHVDNGDPAGVGPVVFLQGGPGIGGISNAPNLVGAQHDLILFDQRGTGASTPKLACPEVDDLWERQLTDDPERRIEDETVLYAAYASCRDRLVTEGVVLGEFHTVAVAADVELLRRLLGYDSWALWGSSYGTRIALTIMRDHPDGVRAAVLDSTVPFEVDFFATIPENALRSLRALDQACQADRCAQDHGDFFSTFTALVRRLNDEPVVVTATRPISGSTFPVRVDGSQLVDMVFTQLYSTRSLRSLPRQISRAEFGGIAELVASYVARRDPERYDLSAGLYYTTWCREEFPFHDESLDDMVLADAEPIMGAALADALGTAGIDRLCETFDVEPAGPVDNAALVSDIPALVFAGAFDPITPPQWSRQVADSLANAIYVEFADHGHGMVGQCPTLIRVAFLTDPTGEVDTSCATTVGGPDFD